jgi:hypothetical protein
MRYRRQTAGYVLYSVGMNGRDDSGRTEAEDTDYTEGWDDEVHLVPHKLLPLVKPAAMAEAIEDN